MTHYFTNDNIESNIKEILVKVKDNTFSFYTDNGVFSKRGLDFGSRSLIDTVLDMDIHGNILDIGCGYGVIGIILSSFFLGNYDLVDVNKRAIHLAKMNVSKNKVVANVFYSDIYSDITKKYDFIITNPPIRVGKDILYKFLFGAKDYLVLGGSLIFVINKDQGAKSVIKDLSLVGKVEILNRNKGFFVIKCIFN